MHLLEGLAQPLQTAHTCINVGSGAGLCPVVDCHHQVENGTVKARCVLAEVRRSSVSDCEGAEGAAAGGGEALAGQAVNRCRGVDWLARQGRSAAGLPVVVNEAAGRRAVGSWQDASGQHKMIGT